MSLHAEQAFSGKQHAAPTVSGAAAKAAAPGFNIARVQ